MSKVKVIKGRWHNINKKIKKTINARYDRIKDWKMDPKGYFLISIDNKESLIKVGYCKFTKSDNPPVHDMVALVQGKTAIKIVNTLTYNIYIYKFYG